MASIASDNANRLADPENLYIPGFEKNLKKKIKSKKKNICQVAAILIIVGKLKIQSGDLHTHGWFHVKIREIQ